MTHNRQCFTNHLGPWACELSRLQSGVAAWNAGQLAALPNPPAADDDEPQELFRVTPDGIAIVSLIGALTKHSTKLGTATTQTRRAIRSAVRDERVRGILLNVDSPGGHVAGTGELAADVRQAAALKPVHAHIDDLGASAAYWVASQASVITANELAEVGSIGVIAVVEDSSEAAKAMGIRVHVIASGPRKGDLTPGTPVTPEMLDSLQARVNEIGAFFIRDVARGRRMSQASVRKVSDGDIWLAAEAKRLGLIDRVESRDETLTAFAESLDARGRNSRAASVRLKIAKTRYSVN